MTTKTVIVTQEVEVTVDETKFTPEFMEDFRDYQYDLSTLDEHMEYLGSLEARGQTEWGENFIEGYGPAEDMGISMRVTNIETEIV
jgi:hypothetical protein